MSAFCRLCSAPRLTRPSQIAPSELASGDETAKIVLTLNLLERPTSPEQMIAFFKADKRHLLTFHGERDPSISTNCNGLIAILHAPEVDKYLPHIEDITNFLCDSYLSGVVTDKWVRSYPTPYFRRLTWHSTLRLTTR